MAQVPYNPVPVADPGATLPSVQVNQPDEAFGGGIGKAISSFGHNVGQAGDAIFNRAIELQNMNNQAEAREASANYSIEVGKLSAEYNTREGNAPQKTMAEYGAAIKQLKDKYKSQLSTTMSQHMFDSQATGTMTHALVSGASHAASQQKAYNNNSFDAKEKSLYVSISTDPSEENVARVRKDLANNQRDWDRQVHNLEPGDPIVKERIRAKDAVAIATQIDGVTTTDGAIKAREVFEKNKDLLTPELRKKYEDTTTTEVRNYLTGPGVRQLIAANTDEDGNLKITEKELYAKAAALAKPYADADDKLGSSIDKAIRSELYQKKTVRKGEILEASQTLYGQMLRGKTTLDEAMKDPQTALAYKSLPNKEQKEWKDRFDRYRSSEDRKYNEEVMKQLDGMRSKSDSMHEILEIDPTSKDLNLSRSNIDTVLRWQKETKANLGKSGKADTFTKLLEDNYSAQMNELKLMDRGKNKDAYDKFTGNVMAAVEGWRESTGSKTYPTNEQFLKAIAPQIMRSQTKDSFGGRWFGSTSTGFERAEPTGDAFTAFRKAKVEEYKAKAEPVDEFEIKRLYSREVYKQLIDLEKKKAKP